jgi:hypothetical protein
MDFEIVSEIAEIETIATGKGVLLPQAREFATAIVFENFMVVFVGASEKELRRSDWRMVLIRLAEVHWYEAHGVGKREFKLKLPLLD